MVYYQFIGLKEEGYIQKYYITFNRERLEKIKNEMIFSCSEIRHRKYKTTTKPNYYDTTKIINYSDTKIGIKYGKGYNPDLDEYLVEYDELVHPLVVNLIEGVLNNNNDSLERLLDIVYIPRKNKEDKKNYYIELRKAEEERKEVEAATKKGMMSFDLGLNKLNLIKEKIEDINKHIELNRSQRNPSYYYQVIRECFDFGIGEMISTKEFEKMIDFFGYEDNEELVGKRITKIRSIIKKTDK